MVQWGEWCVSNFNECEKCEMGWPGGVEEGRGVRQEAITIVLGRVHQDLTQGRGEGNERDV